MKFVIICFWSTFIISVLLSGCYSSQKEESSADVEPTSVDPSEGGISNSDGPPPDEGEVPPNALSPALDASLSSEKTKRQVENRLEPSQCSLGTDKSGCAEDKDCPDRSICYCYPKGSIGNCVESDCVTDADCNGNICAATGAINGNDCSTGGFEFRCITEDDECVDSLECTDINVMATCVFDRNLGHRICSETLCPI